ncbi:Signal transduction histidine kinase [Onishia taeanensis]|uniref:histidine kinase n=1 Tax=Onishia taeanensis TaxID=284577 RepID=A0A1G7UNX4_9GAMM|nr:sensor histidine kinase [Halomonas taeanensis]SDG48430.1 Signal transduction histidine kinase [Halomonas taeanensis]
MSLLRADRRSLRFRLFLWLGSVALIAVAITWLLHGILLRELARDFLGDRLRQEAHYTLQRLHQEQSQVKPWLDSASLTSQMFHHLYVLRLDDTVSTSHPDWLRTLTPYLEGVDDTLLEVRGQDERHLLVYREIFTLEDGTSGTLLIGEDFAEVEAGLATLHWWVGGIAGLVLLLLISLNLVAVNAGLSPLVRLQRQLDELRAGYRERLQLDTPSELDGLVGQLNRFMDEQDKRLKRSRDAVANLSHALKTPLAAVTQVLRGSRPIDGDRRLKLLTRLEDMQAQLDAELRRSRIAGPYAGQLTRVRQEAERLIEMFATLHPDKRFHLEGPQDLRATVSVERQDFTEMLGVVLDNAGKWAQRDVHCRLSVATTLTLVIEDDGPGVPSADLDHLGRRGLRLDEGRPGHGLGLSILRQLVEQYAGHVTFSAAVAGGLAVTIVLPTAAARTNACSGSG